MRSHAESSANVRHRVRHWAGAVEAMLFVVGLAAQFFVWLHVTAEEGRAALMLSMAAHMGIAAVRSRALAQAQAAMPAAPQEAEDDAEDGDEEATPAPADARLAFPSTLTQRSSTLTWPDIEAIPGLQATAALRQHGGDKRAYLRALRHFAQRYKGGVAHWGGWLDRNRWGDLAHAVQTLHEQAGSIGALRVQAGAGRLAMQCDSEDLLGGHAGLPALQEDLMQVLQPLLDAGLGDTAATGSRP